MNDGPFQRRVREREMDEMGKWKDGGTEKCLCASVPDVAMCGTTRERECTNAADRDVESLRIDIMYSARRSECGVDVVSNRVRIRN